HCSFHAFRASPKSQREFPRQLFGLATFVSGCLTTGRIRLPRPTGHDSLVAMDEAHSATSTQEASDESALLSGLRAGDEAAFERLVRGESGRLLATARRILSNEDDARDAVQDAFLSAFRALDSFEGNARVSTWLHRIVVNAALAKLRRQLRKPERSIDDLLPKYLADGHQADPAVEWRESGEAALQHDETRALVRQAIDQLPETYRT